MSAEVVYISDRRELTDSQPLDPQRAKQREVQRRLNMVAHRLDGLEDRHIKIVFDVLGKALDWFDRKGALE
ncbi:MAG TPA: hypothetical protein VLV86_02110 [Vicinamibacterales bacterium]|nr:hypothetical protein [Vicinamibacterales bacterium]